MDLVPFAESPMTQRLTRRRYVAAAAGIGVTSLVGCLDGGPGEDEAPNESDTEPETDDPGEDNRTVDHENPDGEVRFEQPEDGETVSGSVEVSLAVEELELEPVEGSEGRDEEERQDGAVQDGHGHLHVLVDVDCVEPMEHIPFEDGYHHLGEGGTEITLELEPGEYDLCAQASDGAHIAYDMTDEISIEVEDE